MLALLPSGPGAVCLWCGGIGGEPKCGGRPQKTSADSPADDLGPFAPLPNTARISARARGSMSVNPVHSLCSPPFLHLSVGPSDPKRREWGLLREAGGRDEVRGSVAVRPSPGGEREQRRNAPDRGPRTSDLTHHSHHAPFRLSCPLLHLSPQPLAIERTALHPMG